MAQRKITRRPTRSIRARKSQSPAQVVGEFVREEIKQIGRSLPSTRAMKKTLVNAGIPMAKAPAKRKARKLTQAARRPKVAKAIRAKVVKANRAKAVTGRKKVARPAARRAVARRKAA